MANKSNKAEVSTIHAQRNWMNNHLKDNLPPDVRTDIAFASLSYFCPENLSKEECIKAIICLRSIRDDIESYMKNNGIAFTSSLVSGINHKR